MPLNPWQPCACRLITEPSPTPNPSPKSPRIDTQEIVLTLAITLALTGLDPRQAFKIRIHPNPNPNGFLGSYVWSSEPYAYPEYDARGSILKGHVSQKSISYPNSNPNTDAQSQGFDPRQPFKILLTLSLTLTLTLNSSIPVLTLTVKHEDFF